ncbi:MAG TPA: acylphosphatase [Nitrolancea sp.]|nr:acylphosphatase [Nitrolancea sp.]
MNQSDQQAGDHLYCVVTGRVQGVGFRAFVANEARRLMLRGWVRNGEDGCTVEIVVEGETEAVRRFLSLVRQGPPAAVVKRLHVAPLIGHADSTDFTVRP